MNSSVVLKSLNKCKNTTLYQLAMQIPGNRERVFKCTPKITYSNSSTGKIIKQVENPNFLLFEKELVKLDLMYGVDAFVIGYLAKTIDLGIMNNYHKFITKNLQVPLMFKSILKNFYIVDSQEILCNINQNNYYFINQKEPDSITLAFGLGSFAGLSDYLSFENSNYPVIESLYLYLTDNKKMVMKNIEVELNKLIDNDEIYKNDLYISTLLDINYHNIHI